MTLFSLILSFFLIMDPLGNIPVFASILRSFSPERQRKIIIREMLISLVILVSFQYLGSLVLGWIHISIPSIQVAGGLILLIIAIGMIFPAISSASTTTENGGEPFIVPLSVPLVAGPSILAAIMAYAPQVKNHLVMLTAIVSAWAISALILVCTPVFLKILKEKAMTAVTRLMGLILTFIGIEMFLEGIKTFFK